ncbi:transposase [Rhizobium sp. PL01]|uniref:transposase n=1 Tax=Rhizobium sp. PL01 TaxID=3085631 RepID=UPI0039923AC0
MRADRRARSDLGGRRHGCCDNPGNGINHGDNVLLLMDGCLWVLRSGAHWCGLPDRYGRWKTVHRRISRWCHAGVWELVFDALTADRDNQYLKLDSTIVRSHQQAARRLDHQDPYARRYLRQAIAVLHHTWPSQRHQICSGFSRRPAS